MSQDQKRPFRVVVVGAGIVGLSLSHCLQLAGIDHVVLEKHDKVVSVQGAALIIWPQVARIFDQFGILKRIHETTVPVCRERRRWPDGTINHTGKTVQTMSKNFDMPSIIFDRQRCVEHLYDGLPDKSYVRTSAKVDRVEHTESGIRVVTTDGRVEEGDIVIGSDGVHSTIRQQMWDHAAKDDPSAVPETDKNCFSTDFGGLFGVSDLTEDLKLLDSESNVTFGHGHTEMLFTQPGKAYWAIIFKDDHHKPPVRRDGSEQAMEALVEQYGDVPLTDHIKLKQLWKQRSRAGLLNIEEGMLEKWHSGRFVLVGDSAHKASLTYHLPLCLVIHTDPPKMTADLGLGANIAIEGAVTLCNILNRETKSDKHRHFTTAELSALFTEYQAARYVRAKAFTDLSGKATRMNSYQTYFGRFMTGYVAPWLAPIQLRKLSEAFAKGPKLDYVPTRTINEDAPGWKLGEKKEAEGASAVKYLVAAAAGGVAVSYLLMQRVEGRAWRFGMTF
ncbi:hypothetical protein BDZ85DRAFT_204600 [Elsinoe ampelina]|uniref:FAD-binding domain-containing protein n=1 Tax=Elsinoe ampelina TaxID=302913 RepID=A0A6A6G3H0_9PEZI|nr:hypothetical protein BDZ85DRAFT_204600 [Elsinoe ampelina]